MIAAAPESDPPEVGDGVVAHVAWAARSQLRVMFVGPSGAGKTHHARRLHELSGRRGPFVTVDCPAIGPTLFTSELFGHERGAFTDAHAARPGLVTQARGGTLFLEEVGDLAEENQARLLSFLGSGRYRPVGSTRELAADVRVVCASNLDLRRALRPELYRRLSEVVVRVPGLEERPADILALAERLGQRWAQLEGLRWRPLARDARELLLAATWDDNVGGLETAVHVALVRADAEGAPQLTRRHFGSPVPARQRTYEARLAAFEREMLWEVLRASAFNVTEAARRLGVPRGRVHRRMRCLGIASER